MTAVLEPVLRSPRLPQLVEELNRVVEAERAARKRFREELTPEVKAEFINGFVIMDSPARYRHTNVRGLLTRLLSAFVDRHNLGWVGDEKVLVALTRNDFEPDIVYYCQEKAGKFLPDQIEFPAPDLAVEVLSETTEASDRGVKMVDFAAHGVREYWLIDPEKEFVEQYELAGEEYVLRAKQADGTLRSVVVAGFSVLVRAIFDRAENMKCLQQLAAG